MRKLLSALLPSFALFMVFSTDAAEVKSDTCKVSYEKKSMAVQIGAMDVRFSEKNSWTIHSAFYNSKEWLVPSGFMQSVLFEEFTDPNVKDHFLGTGHRPEKVEEVSITFLKNGKEVKKLKIEKDFSIQENADTVVVEKKSKFISEIGGCLLEHYSKVSVLSDRIKEEFTYKGGDGSLGKVKFMYPFMHIFPNSTKYWVAGDDKGAVIESGEFKDDNTFTLNKQFRWALIFDPVKELGTVYCYPETYAGQKNQHNRFWNRPYDNKLYFMSDCVKKKGEEKSYEVTLFPFNAVENDWHKKAQDLLLSAFSIKAILP